MWIGGVRRDSDIRESLDSFQAIQIFRDQYNIGVQGGYSFDAGINGAADLRLLLRFWGEIAIVGISDEMVLQAKCVNRLCNVGSERDDAVDGLREANCAADFVCNLTILRRRLERGRGCLGMANCRAGK